MTQTAKADSSWARLHQIGESNLPGHDKDTLRALLAYADWNTGGNIYVSVPRLAKALSIKARAVGKRLGSLVERGIVVNVGSSHSGTTLRRIDFDKLNDLKGDGRKPVQPRTPKPTPAPQCAPALECSTPLHHSADSPLHHSASKHPLEQPENIQHDEKKRTGKAKTPKANPVSWSSSAGWSGITDQHRKAWEAAYPCVPIDGELRRMNAWLISNPSDANKSNWARFINNWLGKAYARLREGTQLQPAGSVDNRAREREARRRFYRDNPAVAAAHCKALKAQRTDLAPVPDASLIQHVPDALLNMPITGEPNV